QSDPSWLQPPWLVPPPRCLARLPHVCRRTRDRSEGLHSALACRSRHQHVVWSHEGGVRSRRRDPILLIRFRCACRRGGLFGVAIWPQLSTVWSPSNKRLKLAARVD